MINYFFFAFEFQMLIKFRFIFRESNEKIIKIRVDRQKRIDGNVFFVYFHSLSIDIDAFCHSMFFHPFLIIESGDSCTKHLIPVIRSLYMQMLVLIVK
jgi:hypothetical protein